MTHRTVRRTSVLEEKNRKKKFEGKNVVLFLHPVTLLRHPPTPASEPGKLHSDYKMHPHFFPDLGGKSASYSLKTTVIIQPEFPCLHLEREIRYPYLGS